MNIETIKETGFKAIAPLSAATGVNTRDLYHAYNNACVGESDCVGTSITAQIIWKYYLDAMKSDIHVAASDPQKPQNEIARESDSGQEKIYAQGLKQIENGQLMVSIDPSGFRLNHPHTVGYLRMVISKSNNPANRKKAAQLLAQQEKIAARMRL